MPIRLWILSIAHRYLPEVGKAKLEVQSATSTISATAEVAFALIFYFEILQKLRCRPKPLKFVAL